MFLQHYVDQHMVMSHCSCFSFVFRNASLDLPGHWIMVTKTLIFGDAWRSSLNGKNVTFSQPSRWLVTSGSSCWFLATFCDPLVWLRVVDSYQKKKTHTPEHTICFTYLSVNCRPYVPNFNLAILGIVLQIHSPKTYMKPKLKLETHLNQPEPTPKKIAGAMFFMFGFGLVLLSHDPIHPRGRGRDTAK